MDLGHQHRVDYRESLVLSVELTYTHKQQSGGTGEFGEITVKLSPVERGKGISLIVSVKGDNIPRDYIPAVEKGMREQAEIGNQFGFPIIDFEIELLDVKYHDLDSSALAFEIAGRGAMREGARISGTKLLEPIMRVEVMTPEDFLGNVIGDINSRRGQVRRIDNQSDAQAVMAMVPLATMVGYDNALRSLSRGRAQYTMQFSHYDEAPDGGGPPDTEPAAAALRA